MILFFGVRSVVRDDEQTPSQVATCPRCGTHGRLRGRTMRSYFHLFWIPLIPVSKPQSVLECPQCKARLVAGATPRN